MVRSAWIVAAALVVGCNKGGTDSGAGAAPPPDCAAFMTALTNCYAEAGRQLADGGIEAETWCADFEESGSDPALFACYLDQIDAGDCTTSEGIARTSESFQECEDTE